MLYTYLEMKTQKMSSLVSFDEYTLTKKKKEGE